MIHEGSRDLLRGLAHAYGVHRSTDMEGKVDSNM